MNYKFLGPTLLVLILSTLIFVLWDKNKVSIASVTTTVELNPALDDSAINERVYLNEQNNVFLSAVNAIVLPSPDLKKAQKDAEKASKTNRYRFATTINVDYTTDNSGSWYKVDDHNSEWRLVLSSPEALSLNFGFTKYRLPKGAKLTLREPGKEQAFRSFTHNDSKSHGQLWTPLIKSDTVEIHLEVPTKKKADVLLNLTAVNHQFRQLKQSNLKIGTSSSGSCNIDVVCSASESGAGPVIDQYRDQIRSVGAYTVSGVDTCTGALINNTANDNRPFFLTADHCEVRENNAPSVVVYWNFENTFCRNPGDSASGQDGNGTIAQFNTGSIFRATNSHSDVTLIELDSAINPEYNVYYAGWNRATTLPTQTVGIHHPAVSEKRISFDFDPPQITAYRGGAETTHLRVVDWDLGTTEVGSSGSPIFDQNGYIVGQLHGGNAACGNDLDDYYGRFSVSWDHGATNSTRLSNWLDPINSGALTLDGKNLDESISINSVSFTEQDSGTSSVQLTLTLSDTVDETVTVDYTTENGTASAGSDYTQATGQVSFPTNTTSRTISINIINDNTPEENETFSVRLSNAVNASSSAVGIITILNDDFITPVIDTPSAQTTFVGTEFTFPVSAQNTPTGYALASGAPNGATVDSSTGVITWTPNSAGIFSIPFTASNSAGSVNSSVQIGVLDSPILAGIDQNNIEITSSTVPWTIDTSVSFDGVDSARAGDIDDSQSSSFSFAINGPATLSFHWKVSSEERYDLLSFKVNNTEINSISGDQNWALITHEIPSGEHTIAFEYSKDGSVSSLQDTGWVDQILISYPNTNGSIEIQNNPSLELLRGSLIDLSIDAGASATNYSANNLPSFLTLNSTTGQITGVAPLETGEYSFDLIASNEENSDSLRMVLNISTDLFYSALDTEFITYSSSTLAWRRVVSQSSDGVDSLRSGNTDHGQSSWFEFPVNGPAIINFDWRVSSEAGYDSLQLLDDSELIEEISGTSGGWRESVYNVPAGSHIIRFNYIKDFSVSEGDDAGWVDNLSIIQPVTLSLSRSNNSVDLAIDGPTSTDLTLQKSTDMINWTNDTNFSTNTSGLHNHNIVEDGQERYFYRVISPEN